MKLVEEATIGIVVGEDEVGDIVVFEKVDVSPEVVATIVVKLVEDEDRSDVVALAEWVIISLGVTLSVTAELVLELVSRGEELDIAAEDEIITNTDKALLDDAAIVGQASLPPSTYTYASL